MKRVFLSSAAVLFSFQALAAECSLSRETLAVTNAFYITFHHRIEANTDFSQIVNGAQIGAEISGGFANYEDRQLYANEWTGMRSRLSEAGCEGGRISATCMATAAIALKKQKGLCPKADAAVQPLKVGDYVYTQRHCSMVPVRGDSGWCGRNRNIPRENLVSIERISSISKSDRIVTDGPSGTNGSDFGPSELQPVTVERTPFKGISQFKVGSKVWYIEKNSYPPQQEAIVINYDSENQEALLAYEYQDRAFDGSRTFLTRGSFGSLPYSKIYVVKPVLTLRYNGNFYWDENDLLSNVTLDQVLQGRCNSVQTCERIRKAQGKCTTEETCKKSDPPPRIPEYQTRRRLG